MQNKFKIGDIIHKVGYKVYLEVINIDIPFEGMYKLRNIITDRTQVNNKDSVEKRCVLASNTVKLLYAKI